MFTLSLVGVRSTAVSVSVCVSVCPLTCLENDMLKLYEYFFSCYLWLWLSLSLASVKYIMYVLPVLWMMSCLPIIRETKVTNRVRTIVTIGLSLRPIVALSADYRSR